MCVRACVSSRKCVSVQCVCNVTERNVFSTVSFYNKIAVRMRIVMELLARLSTRVR